MTGVVVVGIDGIQCVVTSYLLPFLLFYEMPGGGEYTGPTHTGCPKIKETLFISQLRKNHRNCSNGCF